MCHGYEPILLYNQYKKIKKPRLPFESAPMTNLYCMTSQDFETIVLTSPFKQGQGKQLVSQRRKTQTTSSAKELRRL